MPVPATTGQLRTRIKDMQIGDYIAVNPYPIWAVGTGGWPEMALTGVAINYPTSSKFFWYMIKVNRGLLIMDRVWTSNMSWDTYNNVNNKSTDGFLFTMDGIACKARMLTGGIVFADAAGNKTFNQVSYSLGCWPLNNEWDTYIKFGTLGGTCTPDNDNVWHHKGIYTITQDTVIPGTWKNVSGATTAVAVGTGRMLRGGLNVSNGGWNEAVAQLTTSAYTTVGIRFAVEYKEV